MDNSDESDDLGGPAQFDDRDVELLSREPAYRGFFKVEALRLRHRLFGGGWSGELRRELFARGHAVAAVLYDPGADLVGLIEQFRVGALGEAAGPWCLEVVAGMIEAGETPEQVMRRELLEEAGFKPRQLLPVCEYLSSPGGCDERIHLFCALGDLRGGGGIFGLDSEGEDIRLRVFSAPEVFDAMLQSRMNNAATLIGLQWLQLHRQQLRAGAKD